MDAREAYCSWCFEKTQHELIEERIARRNVHRCGGCGQKTVTCLFCNDMARGYKKWYQVFDDDLCAAHGGYIASFEKLNLQLDNILDYPILFERDKVNVGRIAKTVGGVVLAAGIVAPAAFIAAPAIGGAIGVWMGLSGAAATNAGLATLGGGALAAGGFGMLGGVTVVTAAGAMIGGTMGGVVANSYVKDIENFGITRIKDGIGPSIIVVNGFLTQGVDNADDWKPLLQSRFPDNPWYHLTWESKQLADLGAIIHPNVSKMKWYAILAQAAKSASRKFAWNLGPLTGVLITLGLLDNLWHVALYKAEQTGVLLAEILARTKNSRFILLGHSLGARVIFAALAALSTKGYSGIEDVHLFGGAVGKHPKEEWEKASQLVAGSVHNYYSTNDQVLQCMYRVGTFFTSDPIGYSPIEALGSKVIDKDVSSFVDGHSSYKANAHQFV